MNISKYLWRNEPILSALPEKEIDYFIREDDELIDEGALYKLKNGKYLSIRFYGNTKDETKGFTDLEEFDDEKKALDFFQEHHKLNIEEE